MPSRSNQFNAWVLNGIIADDTNLVRLPAGRRRNGRNDAGAEAHV